MTFLCDPVFCFLSEFTHVSRQGASLEGRLLSSTGCGAQRPKSSRPAPSTRTRASRSSWGARVIWPSTGECLQLSDIRFRIGPTQYSHYVPFIVNVVVCFEGNSLNWLDLLLYYNSLVGPTYRVVQQDGHCLLKVVILKFNSQFSEQLVVPPCTHLTFDR